VQGIGNFEFSFLAKNFWGKLGEKLLGKKITVNSHFT
jgi:hypothetical protein